MQGRALPQQLHFRTRLVALPLLFSQSELHTTSTGWPCSGALPASMTNHSLGLSLHPFEEGTKTIPNLYLETAPKPLQATTAVLKTFLPLPNWLRNPSSVLHHLTIHFAKPNSKLEWLVLMSTVPPSHIARLRLLALPRSACSFVQKQARLPTT